MNVKFEVSCLYQSAEGQKSLSFTVSEISLQATAKSLQEEGTARPRTPMKSIDFSNAFSVPTSVPRKRKHASISVAVVQSAAEGDEITPGGEISCTSSTGVEDLDGK